MQLNTNMVVVVAPMGRDLAAFAEPSHAWDWLQAQPTAGLSIRHPDGSRRTVRSFENLDAFATWCMS